MGNSNTNSCEKKAHALFVLQQQHKHLRKKACGAGMRSAHARKKLELTCAGFTMQHTSKHAYQVGVAAVLRDGGGRLVLSSRQGRQALVFKR